MSDNGPDNVDMVTMAHISASSIVIIIAAILALLSLVFIVGAILLTQKNTTPVAPIPSPVILPRKQSGNSKHLPHVSINKGPTLETYPDVSLTTGKLEVQQPMIINETAVSDETRLAQIHVFPYMITLINSGITIALESSLDSGLFITSDKMDITQHVIMDSDPLVTTMILSYDNPNRQVSVILAMGSPFITIENYGVPLSLKYNTLKEIIYQHYNVYIIDSIYVVITDQPAEIIPTDLTLAVSSIGVIRIAYYHTPKILELLLEHCDSYPISSIVTSNYSYDNDTYHIDTFLKWTNNSLYPSKISADRSHKNLLYRLPHHELANVKSNHDIDFGIAVDEHPVQNDGVSLVTTDNNQWHLRSKVVLNELRYPSLQSDIYTTMLSKVWNVEIRNIVKYTPDNESDWYRWLADLATLILIGDMLKVNISKELIFLRQSLEYVSNAEHYTEIPDCSLGYLMYSYAVIILFGENETYDNDFIKMLRMRLMKIIQDRNWYFGLFYKVECTPGEMINIAYAAYTFGKVVHDTELVRVALAALSTEISAQQHYLQVGNPNNFLEYVNPITQITNQAINRDWLAHVTAKDDGSIDYLAYQQMLFVAKDPDYIMIAAQTIYDNCHLALSYGSTWSSILYWIFTSDDSMLSNYRYLTKKS